jgi:hypothetical protein
MSDIMNRLMLRLKVNSLSHCGIVAPLILFELFTLNCKDQLVNNIGSRVPDGTRSFNCKAPKLVQSHCVVNEQPNWHLWVTLDDKVYDISALMISKNGLFDKVEYHNDTSCSCNLQKLSGSLDLVSQWELYQESPSKFWDQVPMKTQTVRRDILKRFKSGKL